MSQDGWKQQARQASENIWQTLKQTGGNAADAAQKALQLQKLNAQIRRIQSQQRKVVFTIGQKVYELHGRGKVRNKDVLVECQKIDDLAEQVENIKAQIAQIRADVKAGADDALEDETFLTDDAGDQAVEVDIEFAADEAPEPVDAETEPEISTEDEQIPEPVDEEPEATVSADLDDDSYDAQVAEETETVQAPPEPSPEPEAADDLDDDLDDDIDIELGPMSERDGEE